MVRFPFVSRDRLDEVHRSFSQTTALLGAQLEAAALREERLLAIIEGLTKQLGAGTKEPTEASVRVPYVYPPEILNAVRARAAQGSKLEARLLRQVREMLPDNEVEEVVKSILDGSKAFDDEPW